MEAWVGSVDRRLRAWADDVEASGGARTRQWGLGRSTMGLGVGRRSGSAEQVGDLGRRNRSAVRELAGRVEG